MTDQELYDDYINNAAAFLNCEKLDGKEPDETLMRQVEEAIGVPEQAAWDFRSKMVRDIAAASILGRTYDWRNDIHLVTAIQQIVGGA